jgi:hypothetical protein
LLFIKSGADSSPTVQDENVEYDGQSHLSSVSP